jgi:hypothetical protein
VKVNEEAKPIDLIQKTNEKKPDADERHGWKSAIRMPRGQE